MTTKLPSVPHVSDGESFTGLVRRIAQLYGMSDADALTSTGWTDELGPRPCMIDKWVPAQNILRAVAHRTGLAGSRLRRLFLAGRFPRALAHRPDGYALRCYTSGSCLYCSWFHAHHFPVCRRCIADDPLASPLSWRIKLLPACPTHATLLIDRCQRCCRPRGTFVTGSAARRRVCTCSPDEMATDDVRCSKDLLAAQRVVWVALDSVPSPTDPPLALIGAIAMMLLYEARNDDGTRGSRPLSVSRQPSAMSAILPLAVALASRGGGTGSRRGRVARTFQPPAPNKVHLLKAQRALEFAGHLARKGDRDETPQRSFDQWGRPLVPLDLFTRHVADLYFDLWTAATGDCPNVRRAQQVVWTICERSPYWPPDAQRSPPDQDMKYERAELARGLRLTGHDAAWDTAVRDLVAALRDRLLTSVDLSAAVAAFHHRLPERTAPGRGSDAVTVWYVHEHLDLPLDQLGWDKPRIRRAEQLLREWSESRDGRVVLRMLKGAARMRDVA